MTTNLLVTDPYLEALAIAVALLVLGTGTLQNALYIAKLAVAYTALTLKPADKRADRMRWLSREDAPPVSVLVPAYNEETTIVENVRSLLSLRYPRFEIIVINDGSRDRTLDAMVEAFDLHPVQRFHVASIPHQPIRGIYGSPRHRNLIVVDKENGGKADALNAGINISRLPLFCAVDADSILDAHSLLRAVQPFMDDADRVVAVGGTLQVANGCKVRSGRVVQIGVPRSPLPLFQTIEYLRAFVVARIALSRVGALTLISGAFGILRRNVAVAVGGYSPDTVGEDLEIIVRIHRHMRERRRPYAIRFIPEPVCWTEVPSSIRGLAGQRIRWQRGALETFFKHIRMLFNPHYGRVGTLGLGQMLLIDVVGPPVEAIGYVLFPVFWALGILNWHYFAAFLAVTFVFGIFVSVGSLMLGETQLHGFPKLSDLLLVLLAAVLENFGYRQLITVFRVLGFCHYLGKVEGWGKSARTGFQPG